MAENIHGPPPDHICFRKWKGSSSAMEADVSAEGFNKSVEMHGLRFNFFIGDGDSSTFAKLKTNVAYGASIQKNRMYESCFEKLRQKFV